MVMLSGPNEVDTKAADAPPGSTESERAAFLDKNLNSVSFSLPPSLMWAVDARLESACADGWSDRLWRGDASLWTDSDEGKWVGWLPAGLGKQISADALKAFSDEVRRDGFTHVVLLGMGGSSLGPEVLARTLGSCEGYPELLVLDSTDPAEIASVEARIDFARTLFIVASKSGSTLEPELLRAYFFTKTEQALGKGSAGQHFAAITDPDSRLDNIAKADGYRSIFHGDPTIGGRYSVLSVFGMVPLAITGHDVGTFFRDVLPMVEACGPNMPAMVNPGLGLGVVLGEAARAGRDKLTIFVSPKIASLGAWLEQLVAESTGKGGKGIVPVDLEPIGSPELYGDDRLFAYIGVAGEKSEFDATLNALIEAGHPVIRVTVAEPNTIGQEFFRWEVATAIAGASMGINPFDQPDVEASKVKTRTLTDAHECGAELASEVPFAMEGCIAFFGDASLAEGGASAETIIARHFARLKAGDYAAVLAYVERTSRHEALIGQIRLALRESRHVATVGGFGPRFLHSTGQVYKGGPNSGVFLQTTADPKRDIPIPGRAITFGVVEAAQACGDLDVLAERGRRHLRINIRGGDVEAGLQKIARAMAAI